MDEMKLKKYLEMCKGLKKKMDVMDLADEEEEKDPLSETGLMAEGAEEVSEEAPEEVAEEKEGLDPEILEMLKPAKKPKKKEGVLSIAIMTAGKKKAQPPMGKKAKG